MNMCSQLWHFCRREKTLLLFSYILSPPHPSLTFLFPFLFFFLSLSLFLSLYVYSVVFLQIFVWRNNILSPFLPWFFLFFFLFFSLYFTLFTETTLAYLFLVRKSASRKIYRKPLLQLRPYAPRSYNFAYTVTTSPPASPPGRCDSTKYTHFLVNNLSHDARRFKLLLTLVICVSTWFGWFFLITHLCSCFKASKAKP